MVGAVTPNQSACGGEAQNRTGDTRIFSPLLYRLSYLAKTVGEITGRVLPLSSSLSFFLVFVGFDVESVFQFQHQPIDGHLVFRRLLLFFGFGLRLLRQGIQI